MLKMGVVGMGMGGGHGATIHKSGIAELTAVCDKDAEKLKWRLETYEKELNLKTRGYTDFEEMLTREKLDGVVISTPSGIHHQQAVIAACHGVNMLVDKPIDITMEHIDRIEQAVSKAGVLCGVNYQMRFGQAHYAVKQAIDRGDFGRLLLVDVRMKWYRDQAYYDRGGWRGTWAMDGGGSMMNQGVHAIDMLCWYAGRPRRVRGEYAILNHKIETEDWAAGIVEFESGVRSVVSTTTNVFPKTDRTWLEVHGTKGSAFLLNGEIQETNIESLQNPEPAPYPNAVIDFLHAVKDNRPPMCGIEQGRWSVQLILSVYNASRQGKTVEI